MTLTAELGLHIGDLDLDIAFECAPGSVTAVLGPNAAGKSTTLRCLAGLLAVERGRIVLDDTVLDDPDLGRFVLPEARRVGLVHQDGLLFPHLTALDNVAFGPRSRGASRSAAREAASEWLRRVGLESQANAKPPALSGGQAQRVALARALVSGPRLLLLDEPLGALDAGTRVEIRRELRRHLDEFDGVTVLVTHDPTDALALAEHVIILEGGRVAQDGTLVEVTQRPRSSYVADLIGTNLIRGAAVERRVDAGRAEIQLAEPAHGDVFVVIPPRAVALHRLEPEGSPRNRWSARIEGFDQIGDRVRVRLVGDLPLVAEVTPAAVSELGLTEGGEVWASVKATEIDAYPI
jgi:molybdate transport system ATP-binding protein